MSHNLSEIVTEETMIPSDTPGIDLFIRNKRRGGLSFDARKTVLFVAGSTYPASSSFDLRLDGLSWMDHLSLRGFDVYLIDVRGYGRSSKPVEMAAPAADHPPVVRTPVAVRDVTAGADHIRKTRGLAAINVIGWSWGTTLMARLASEQPQAIEKLVLIAPQWLRTTPSAADMGGELGAYRTIARSAAKARWLAGVPEAQQEHVLPSAWFDAWADATFTEAGQPSDTIRAPNGTVQDSREFWAAGTPLYDPARITVPTLIVHGDRDRDCPMDMSQAVFGRLTSAPYRRWVEIGDGTHSLFMETNRWQVFDAVDAFLSEHPPA